ncbi:MAG: hypothetical protein E7590_10220 [Ruminococcaceae bacterium]|nr:hypothetical protein [Oscillospiraceae bacterium]
MATVRDKLWMFGVRPHQDDVWFTQPRKDRLYSRSRITPAEGAFMLDIPNMLLINCDGEPAPFSHDAYGYAESFCRMDRVWWGSSGSGGFRTGNEEKFICELAKRYPNVCGAYMDDFLHKLKKVESAEERDAVLDEICRVRAELDKAERPMELAVTWYMNEMSELDARAMRCIDTLVLWTWSSEELPLMEERFARIEQNYPNHKKLIGLYIYDFPNHRPVPLDLMEHQCETSLRWLREGRIDGMVVEANSTMGVGFESEYWLRKWIERVKGIAL